MNVNEEEGDKKRRRKKGNIEKCMKQKNKRMSDLTWIKMDDWKQWISDVLSIYLLVNEFLLLSSSFLSSNSIRFNFNPDPRKQRSIGYSRTRIPRVLWKVNTEQLTHSLNCHLFQLSFAQQLYNIFIKDWKDDNSFARTHPFIYICL